MLLLYNNKNHLFLYKKNNENAYIEPYDIKTEETCMKLWVKSDWNGFFGLFTNNLTNILTMAVLLSFVVGLPDAFVYGKFSPLLA